MIKGITPIRPSLPLMPVPATSLLSKEKEKPCKIYTKICNAVPIQKPVPTGWTSHFLFPPLVLEKRVSMSQ